jgi:hypothetical protein
VPGDEAKQGKVAEEGSISLSDALEQKPVSFSGGKPSPVIKKTNKTKGKPGESEELAEGQSINFN